MKNKTKIERKKKLKKFNSTQTNKTTQQPLSESIEDTFKLSLSTITPHATPSQSSSPAMSKMKHLLRKLHIGTDNNHHHSRRRSPSPRETPASASASSSVSASSPPSDFSDRVVRDSPATSSAAIEENVTVSGGGNRRYFNIAEEEYQMQLAMALSVSDPEMKKDEELDQIKAAKQLSLACSPSVPDNERISELVSLKYWNYNVVQYDDKVVDGFYDVYAIASNSTGQGKMPLLVDLQAVSIMDNVEYEVVLVNRLVDSQLQQLENKVYAILLECRVRGIVMNSLIQRIADLVVDRMGGPVGDAEEVMKRWIVRSNQLRSSFNTIVLPLGCLDVGLSRHRALLFKVLADRINLPCMLVKGSLYTGTDEGAVNLIKFDDGSEYIIDLMGAPGTLIPAEVPSSLLLDTAMETRGFPDSSAAVHNMSMVLDKVVRLKATIPSIEVPELNGSEVNAAALISVKAKQEPEITVGSGLSVSEISSQYEYEKHVRPELCQLDGFPSPAEEATLAQEKKVKDVSKYVISAAKDPEFAQKLHAVLLESGASPPPDLFMNISPGVLDGNKMFEEIQLRNETSLQLSVPHLNNCDNNGGNNTENCTGQKLETDANPVCYPLHSEPNNEIPNLVATANSQSEMPGHDGHKVVNQIETGGEGSAGKVMENAKKGALIPYNGHNEILGHVSGEVCPMLGEVAEWEIPWEDLQIGERIGIGSYGEVYRADWNGTEVAVKKFLVQDFTCDVLNQFKSEAEMMIRLRHPNVVLFMGAVTRPPNLSILTEFLPRGSLYRLLHRSGAQIPEKKRMKMALDVARGMNYLHTSHPTVVHRDLKSPNLLVDKNWVVKVCDFGLSRLKHHTFLSSNSTAGTPEWMAPEVLRNEPSNEKCDVYSFGVILWELTTLCMPWSGLNPMQVVGAVGFQNRRLDIPEVVDPTVARIIQDCWENDPQVRPSFSQLIARIKGLQRLVVH